MKQSSQTTTTTSRAGSASESPKSERAGLVKYSSAPARFAADSKVALLVIAHMPLASALKDVAQHVFGEDVPITAVDVLPGACAADSSDALMKQLMLLNQGAGVLIMTDLPGASPSNVCASAASKARELGTPCLVVAGVNAAMVLRAISHRGYDLESLVKAVITSASQAVMRLD